MNDSNVPHTNFIHIINDFKTRWDWNLNDILVFSSLMVFLLVVCSCTFMWITRPAPRKQIIDVQRQMEVADRIREVLKHGSASSVEGKKLKEKKKSKKKKKESLDDSQSSKESEDTVSLLHTRLAGIDEESGGGQLLPSQDDSVLAQTLLTVFGQGMTLIIYNEHGAKRTKVTLVGGSVLQWRTDRLFSKKGKQLNIREVQFVNWGKQTNKFHLPGSRIAVEDSCFSLVTARETLDFEASSKAERDALAQGFTILMTRFKEKTPQEEIKWGKG
mmetsp:Transcript_24336/g.23381  ORF Transcript_24336/g.23381 Transcript_24336/m.23381 type:complete len:273 (+) Transcript_24336:157-975(+)